MARWHTEFKFTCHAKQILTPSTKICTLRLAIKFATKQVKSTIIKFVKVL